MANVIINDTHLTDIADSIRGKNGTNNKYKPSEMASAISNIEMGIIPSGTLEINENGEYDVKSYEKANVNVEGTGGKYKPRYISFSEYAGTELNDELTNLDTSNVTNMNYMFSDCENIKSLDLSSFNTSNVTNMNYMFATCENIKSLDLSNFNTSNVTTMMQMFNRCQKVTSLNVSSFDTSNVTSMMQMFYSCYKLTSLDLSNFNTSNVTDMSNMFAGDFALTKLDIRNFTFDKVKSYTGMFNNVPANCLIIVKDDDAKTWVLARRSDLTNIKTVAEYEAS